MMAFIPLMVLISFYLAFSHSPERYNLVNSQPSVTSETIKLYHAAAIKQVVEQGKQSGVVSDIFESGPFVYTEEWGTEVFSSSDNSETVLVTYAFPTGTGATDGLTYDEGMRRAFAELSDIGTIDGYQSYVGRYVPNENMWFGGSVGGKTFSSISINIPSNSPAIITYLGDITTS